MVLDPLPPLTRRTLARHPTFEGVHALLRALDGDRDAAIARATAHFAGYHWLVGPAAEHEAPGLRSAPRTMPNVWVDDDGGLHLRLTRTAAGWRGAELATMTTFGYGAYRWVLDSTVDSLDPNVALVFGISSSVDAKVPGPAAAVEVARYGDHYVETAQYAVQGGPTRRFWQPTGLMQSTHTLVWTPTGVRFQSACGAVATPLDATDRRVYADWQSGMSAESAEAAVRMSLTLHQGRPPADRREVEVVVRSFSFTPLEDISPGSSA